MIFAVIAHDHPGAFEKRMSVRNEHLAKAAQAKNSGQLVLACALKNDDAQPVGSVMIFKFESRDDMEAYLEREPYVINDVWGDIEVREGAIPDLDNI